MRVLFVFILALAAIPVAAQNPVVRIDNTTRPGSADFLIGDRFEIVLTAAAYQPVSVRTTRRGRTDWGPVVGWTDTSGRWSTTGQFEKSDFGDWREVWTVGGKVANRVAEFTVAAPCLKGGQNFMSMNGPPRAPSIFQSCQTATGVQSFVTPSYTDPFRAPDGRVVPGSVDSNITPKQYQAEVLQNLVMMYRDDRPGYETVMPDGLGDVGDEAGASIAKTIGINALTEDETRNVLAIVRAAFEMPERIPQAAREPSATLLLLQNLSNAADHDSLKQQIAETIAWVRVR
jgi:hypothetical protein